MGGHRQLPTVVEILSSRVAIGPAALVLLERSKGLALVRRDHEVASSCGQVYALIFVHDFSHSRISSMARISEGNRNVSKFPGGCARARRSSPSAPRRQVEAARGAWLS